MKSQTEEYAGRPRDLSGSHCAFWAGCLTLVSVAALAGSGLQPFQYLSIGLLLAVISRHMLAIFSRVDDLFAPVNILAFYFLINFAMRAAYLFTDPASNRVGVLYYDDYIPPALCLATLGFVCFRAGTRSSLTRKLGQHFALKATQWHGSLPFVRILIMYALGAAGTFYLFQHGARTVGNVEQDILNNKYNPMPGSIVLMATLINVGVMATAAFFLARHNGLRGRLPGWILLAIGMMLVTVQFSLTGKKSSVLEPVVASAIIYHYLKSRMTAGKLLAAGIPMFLLTFGALNVYRYSIIGEAGGAPRNLGEVADRVGYALNYFHSGRADDIGSSSVSSFMGREFGVDSLALVVKYTPKRKDFGLGERYLGIPAQILIPRQLWPDKPIDYFTGDFEDNYAVGWHDAYTSPHVISDLYQNFHIFGIAGGMFFIGMVFQTLYRACRPWLGQAKGVFIYAALIPGLVLSLEWEPVAICQFYVRYGVLIFGLAWILGISNKTTAANQIMDRR